MCVQGEGNSLQMFQSPVLLGGCLQAGFPGDGLRVGHRLVAGKELHAESD